MGVAGTWEAEVGGKKYRFDVDFDEFADSPMEDFDRDFDKAIQQGDFAIIGFHRRYDIGHKHDFKTADDVNDWIRIQVQEGREIRVAPLYMYEHSMIALSIRSFIGRAHHAEWNSGQLGIVVWDYTKVNPDDILQEVEGFLETYTQYLNGEVYYMSLSEVDSDGDEIELIDCTGNQYLASDSWEDFIKGSMQGCGGDREIQKALMEAFDNAWAYPVKGGR